MPASKPAPRSWSRPLRGSLMAALIAALLLPAGCGSPGHINGGPRTSNTLAQEDLIRLDVATAYQAVERLRPEWLRGRGPVSSRNPDATLPTVYVAGIRQQGGPAALRQVRLGDVQEIQYLSAVDATTRYGTDNAGGAILVILR